MPDAELLPIAVEAVQAAGAHLLAGLDGTRTVTTKSSATDMVSEMDRQAEDLIRSIIWARRPDDLILGEEAGLSRRSGLSGPPDPAPSRSESPAGDSAVRWIVDPLDGTTNYLYRLPAWCVSVAAEEEGRVVAGAVFDPIHAELWTAVAGQGAWGNGVALNRLESDGDLATALVATGFSYSSDRRAAQGQVAAHLLPAVRDLRRAGSAALDLCWVAAGRVDAYFEGGTRIWDRAAGALIATEAGAWVGGINGGPATDDGVLAAHPALAAKLQALIAQAASA